MANEGFFTRLLRRVNNALARTENTEVRAIADFEGQQANAALRDAAQAKERERTKPMFSSGLLARVEQAEVRLIADFETRQATAALRDTAQAKEKERAQPMFSLVSATPEIHIHGGESIHSAPKAPRTPAAPNAGKSLPLIKI
jgi:hypothetical protein